MELLNYVKGITDSYDGTEKLVRVKFVNESFKQDIASINGTIKNDVLEIETLVSCEKEENLNVYLRGFFDSSGYVKYNTNTVKATLVVHSDDMMKKLVNILCHHVAIKVDGKRITIEGSNAIEFLHFIYKDAKYYSVQKFKAYNHLLFDTSKPRTFKFIKTSPDAVTPTKNKVTDSGYDLYIIKKMKEVNGMVMYDTGIKVQPPRGYYFDLVGRSSISKTGYMLSNNIGIIDNSYTGNIMIALTKVVSNAEELVLPMKIAQLIPRKVIHFEAIEVSDESEFISTSRGTGGFGSSGN